MDLKNQLEALLFSSGKAMEEAQLCQLTGGTTRAVRNALRKLRQEYADRDTALKVFNEGTAWKLLVKDAHVPLVRRIVADTELSRATMETLAVIAYHQPNVLQSKVVELRGGNAYEQIKELEGLGFVTKAKQGRSFSLKLTEKFFDYFDVEGEKGIRQVFKEVQAPLPAERQRKLGDLEVVEALPDRPEQEAKGALGPLEVVDEAAEEPASEGAPAKVERDDEAEKGFLAKIEAQIDEIAKRNDERAEDPDFRPSAPPEGAAGEEAAPEGGEATAEEPTESAETAPEAETPPEEDAPAAEKA